MIDKIYICDNGAVYCYEHLGVTAKSTGRDISGQKIIPIDANTHGLKCECCK